MSEVLLIPELRDAIADFGIPNYQFLRCLNKEFHQIWEDMFDSAEMTIFMPGKEYELYLENTRILEYSPVALDIGINPKKMPSKIRYLVLEKSLTIDKLLPYLDLFKNLHTIDLGGGILDLSLNYLCKKYVVKNYIQKISPSVCDYEFIEEWKTTHTVDDRTLGLFSSLVRCRYNDLYILYDGSEYILHLDMRGCDFYYRVPVIDPIKYASCAHIRIKYKEIDDLIDLFEDYVFNLKRLDIEIVSTNIDMYGRDRAKKDIKSRMREALGMYSVKVYFVEKWVI